MALIDKAPRIATGVARTNAKIVPVDEKHFLFLIQQNFAVHVMRVLSERLRRRTSASPRPPSFA
jgi:CRP-like cAMP-binding protein